MTDEAAPFHVTEARGTKVPLVISVPHCGIEFPSEITDLFHPDLVAAPDDTDWFVHDLYDFAPELGITVIHARYSRWVIDLNRDPSDISLYSDGRLTTALVPTTTFTGRPLYVDEASVPDAGEKRRRLGKYFLPYHERVRAELRDRIETFGRVVLWDAHSIRRLVPTIRKDPFPDMILGDADGRAADTALTAAALGSLGGRGFTLSHNDPFKGGHITRSFGDPKNGVHALQLEMSKDVYMDDTETCFDETRAARIREVLSGCLESLVREVARTR